MFLYQDTFRIKIPCPFITMWHVVSKYSHKIMRDRILSLFVISWAWKSICQPFYYQWPSYVSSMVTMYDDFWHHPYWTFNFIYFLFIIFVWQPATQKFHAWLVFLHIYTRILYTFILLEWNYIYCYTWSKGKPQENGFNVIAGNDINRTPPLV